jgi:hypothetical protein
MACFAAKSKGNGECFFGGLRIKMIARSAVRATTGCYEK